MALIALEGVTVGALTGFVGVGGGFLIVPALVFLRKLPIHYAVGTSLIIISLKSAAGFVKYQDVLRVEQLSIHWMTVFAFVALGAVGTLLGTRLNGLMNPQTLRRAFGVFLLVMSAFILVREGSQLASASMTPPAQSQSVEKESP